MANQYILPNRLPPIPKQMNDAQAQNLSLFLDETHENMQNLNDRLVECERLLRELNPS